MKKNIFLAGLIAVAALSSCDNDDSYSAAPFEKGSKVFFSNSLPSVINPSSLESSYAITLNRTDVGESLDVALNVTNSGENFLVPTTASFAADSKEAQITISYDIDKVGFDVFDTITIAVDPALASLYSVAEYTFVIGIPAPWKSLGKGLIVDDYVTTFYTVENVSWEVEIQENELYPGYFRLVNPYCENYPYNDPGDWDASTNFYLEIHAEDPAKVYIPTQVSNTAWSFGNFIFSSLAGYYLAKGDVDNAEGYYGKFENGIISFPPEALLFGMTDYQDAGLYTSNVNGAFKVVMPGIVLADYSAEVKYSGKMYDADDNLYIVASATLGADVEEIRLAVCAAGEEEAIAEALANGTLKSAVSLSESGSVNLPFDADAVSGKYSIVGVTFGGGEAQELVSATFKYTSLNGEPVETWTAYFVGTATYNCLWEEPETDPEVVLSASDNDPTQERCKVAPWINNDEGMIFSWPEEGDIVVAPNQEVGLTTTQGAEVMVADMAAECLLVPGTSWAQVVISNFPTYLTGDENKPSAFASNLFSFNVIYYTEGGSVLGWGFDTYKLTANASAPGARNLFAPAEKQTPHLQFIEHPLILKNCVRRDAVRAF